MHGKRPQQRELHRKITLVGNVLKVNLFNQGRELRVQLHFAEGDVNELDLLQFWHGHFEAWTDGVVVTSGALNHKAAHIGHNRWDLVDLLLQIWVEEEHQFIVPDPPVVGILERLDGVRW